MNENDVRDIKDGDPRTFNRIFWERNRSAVASGCNMGRALQDWSVYCSKNLKYYMSSIDINELNEAYKASIALIDAAKKAIKRCRLKLHISTRMASRAYKNRAQLFASTSR